MNSNRILISFIAAYLLFIAASYVITFLTVPVFVMEDCRNPHSPATPCRIK